MNNDNMETKIMLLEGMVDKLKSALGNMHVALVEAHTKAEILEKMCNEKDALLKGKAE